MVVTVNNIETPKNPKLKELHILLGTERGTVPLFRGFGLDPRMIDKPITIIVPVIFTEIHDQIKRYIEGLNLIDVKCSQTNKGLKIECEVEFDG